LDRDDFFLEPERKRGVIDAIDATVSTLYKENKEKLKV
jgi:hypothetical protein